MAHDPTRWPTPMHAFRYYRGLADSCEKTLYEIREAYEHRYGRSTDTNQRIRADYYYQDAVGDLMLYTARAETYGHQVTHRILEAQIAEARLMRAELQRQLGTQPPA